MQHYAITKYGRTKDNPLALIRLNDGVFEQCGPDGWAQTSRYDGILSGDYNEYDSLSAEEAKRIEEILYKE